MTVTLPAAFEAFISQKVALAMLRQCGGGGRRLARPAQAPGELAAGGLRQDRGGAA